MMKKHKVETPESICKRLEIDYNTATKELVSELTKQIIRQLYDISLLSPSDKTQASLKIIKYMKGTPYEQQRFR